MNIPFFKPTLTPEETLKVSEVLESGWLTTGKKTAEFERNFAKYVNAKFAIMVNSGTAALHLSLDALGIGPGDEVITTPYTFAATSEIIEDLGATPVFVDVNRNNLNIDINKIEEKISPQTKALLPVHFSGNPCEMEPILNLAQKFQLKVVEDAAHCTPAFYKNKPIGSIGDCTCFSFYANKCITTGEGGMITTDNPETAEKAKILRLHGLSHDAINRYQEGASWEYDILHKGYKYNPTDISAAQGLEQLKYADEFLRKRTLIAQKYLDLLKNDVRIQLYSPESQNTSSWHLFPIRLQGNLVQYRNEIINQLQQVGISVAVHFKPLHLHTYYREKYGYTPMDFPVATDAFEREISLPLYPELKENEIAYIANNLQDILDKF